MPPPAARRCGPTRRAAVPLFSLLTTKREEPAVGAVKGYVMCGPLIRLAPRLLPPKAAMPVLRVLAFAFPKCAPARGLTLAVRFEQGYRAWHDIVPIRTRKKDVPLQTASAGRKGRRDVPRRVCDEGDGGGVRGGPARRRQPCPHAPHVRRHHGHQEELQARHGAHASLPGAWSSRCAP